MEDPEERPRRPILNFLSMILTTALVGAVLLQGVGWWRAPDLPDEAPAFAVTTLSGEQLDLAGLRGKTVVLNFWATWCGPCRLEAPSFAAFAKSNPDVVVLGLAEDAHEGKVLRAMGDLGITYPVALASRELLKTYGVNTFPTTVIIGADGSVRSAHTGLLTRPQLWAMTR